MGEQKEQNLLFAVLAVQLKGVSPQKAMEAASAWIVDPSRPLSARLIEMGVLSADDVQLIDHLVEEAVRTCQGDAAAALESIRGGHELKQTVGGVGPQDPTRFMEEARVMPLTGPELSPVEELPGRYSHISEHGRGGMGRVLLVHDQCLGRDIALKELLLPHDTEYAGPAPSPMRETSGLLIRFLQEARVTSQLEHPSIVPVYELGRRLNGTLYYTMRLVRGKTLSKTIADCKSIEERLRFLPNILALCQAMAYSHSRGVIHRDIKPSNLMVGEFGETVVLDWGLAKAMGQDDVNAEKLENSISLLKLQTPATEANTATGQAIGTPHYMPPEQAEGRISDIDERSDVYAVGSVLYELLTGKPPFEGKTVKAILDKVSNEEPARIDALAPNAPPDLASICNKAMQKDPKRRYQSMTELCDELLRFQTGAFVQAHSYGIGETVLRYYRKHKAVFNTAAAGVAALLVLGVFSYISIWRAQKREHAERVIAEQARADETQARQLAERKSYLSQIHLAEAHMEEKRHGQANQALWDTPALCRGWEWGYLLNKANPELFTVEAPGDLVHLGVFSPDGAGVAACFHKGAPRIYDARTGAPRVALEPQGRTYNCAAFSPNGAKFAAGSDGPVDVWEIATGKLSSTLAGTTPVNDVQYDATGARLFAAHQDGRVGVFNTASGKLEKEWRFDLGELYKVLPTSVGNRLLVVGNQGKICGFDTESEKTLFTVAGGDPALSPDGTTLAALDANDVALYDARTGAPLRRLSGHTAPVRHVAFDKKGARLLSASEDGSARLWTTKDGRELAKLTCNEPVLYAFFLDKGQWAATLSFYNNYTVWNLDTGARLRDIKGRGQLLQAAELAPDARRIATASGAEHLQVWDLLNLTGEKSSFYHEPAYGDTLLDGTRFFPSRGQFAAWYSDGYAAIHQTKDCLPQGGYQVPYPNTFSEVALSPDGTRLAMVIDSLTPVVFKLPENTPMTACFEDTGAVNGLAFSPDGARVASACSDGVVRIWNPDTGQTETVIETKRGPVNQVVFSPDGQSVLTAGGDHAAALWSAKSGKPLISLSGHQTPVTSAGFSPDGRQIVTATADGEAILWNASDGARVQTVSPSTAGAMNLRRKFGVRFSQDGKYLVRSLPYQATSVWDAGAGEFLFSQPSGCGMEILADNGYAIEAANEAISMVEAAPWKPDAPSAAPGKTWQERYQTYRSQRTAAPRPAPVCLDSKSIIAPTGRHFLASACQNVLEILRSPQPQSNPPVEEKGLRIIPGPLLIAAVPFSFIADDDVVAIAGKSIENRAEAVDALENLGKRLEDEKLVSVDVSILRNSKPRIIQYRVFPEKVAKLDIALPQAKAADLVKSVLVASSAMQSNETYSRHVAAFSVLMEVPPADTGLLPGDLICAVDGQRPPDHAAATKNLETLLGRIEAGGTGPFAMDIQRGMLQTLHIDYSVKPGI